MAHPEMSYKIHLHSDPGQQHSTLPIHDVDSSFASQKSFAKPGFFKGLAVGLVILAASCFSLHLFSHKSVYLDPIHSSLVSDMTRLDTNHMANTDFVAGLDGNCDGTLPVSSSNLARRQTPNHKWFFIPISSRQYSFTSRGLVDNSTFHVVPFRSPRSHMVVKVEVVKDPQGSARVSPLRTSRRAEPSGVKISNNPQTQNKLGAPAFNVTVYIPIPDHRLRLNSFETNLPGFEHIFPDLSRYVEFSSLRISTTNAPLNLGSQVADEFHVSNVNAPIISNLTGSIEIDMSNRNGMIDGEYTLSQADGTLKIKNANSAITARVRLQTRNPTARSAYHLDTYNNDGTTNLTILEQPMGSGLYGQVANVWAPLSVHLNEAFEGRFTVKTGITPSAVHINNANKTDPTGRGRKRVVELDEGTEPKGGDARWEGGDDSSDHPYGDLSMSSLGGETELFFD